MNRFIDIEAEVDDEEEDEDEEEDFGGAGKSSSFLEPCGRGCWYVRLPRQLPTLSRPTKGTFRSATLMDGHTEPLTD
jgi:hypothetical protein